jgi:hypothetical protein
MLAFEINHLLDRGLSVPIDETHERVDDGTVLEWLAEQFANDQHYLDLSWIEDADRFNILAVFASLSNAVNSRRKFGVENNGLALLVAYCIEVMQNSEGYEDFGVEDLT